MSVVRITSKRLSVAEQRGLDRLQGILVEAEQSYNSAILGLKEAHRVKARAKRDHKRALDELTKYRERIGQ